MRTRQTLALGCVVGGVVGKDVVCVGGSSAIAVAQVAGADGEPQEVNASGVKGQSAERSQLRSHGWGWADGWLGGQ